MYTLPKKTRTTRNSHKIGISRGIVINTKTWCHLEIPNSSVEMVLVWLSSTHQSYFNQRQNSTKGTFLWLPGKRKWTVNRMCVTSKTGHDFYLAYLRRALKWNRRFHLTGSSLDCRITATSFSRYVKQFMLSSLLDELHH